MDAAHPFESANSLDSSEESSRQKPVVRNMNSTDELIQRSLNMKEETLFEDERISNRSKGKSENFVLIKRDGSNKALVVYHDHLIRF